MILTIASGKGGTGKTTVATNLVQMDGQRVKLLDCDVEEPNCFLFLRPDIQETIKINMPVPEVDETKCTGCGKCSEICQFKAIASFKTPERGFCITFPELCHGCGGCMLVCPEDAVTWGQREVGIVETGFFDDIKMVHGRLRIGEAMSPPLIKAVKKYVEDGYMNIIDAPPGTSCPVIEAVKGSDYVVLVTEPTPFGLNDLVLAVEMVREINIPMGVVINRADVGNKMVYDYCMEQGLPILLEIPYDRKIAEVYSRGECMIKSLPKYHKLFSDLLFKIKKEVQS